MVTIKSEKEIKLMREACRVTGLVYKEIEKANQAWNDYYGIR